MKHLHWLIPGLYSDKALSLQPSQIASIRLRCIPSIRAAQDCGWKISFGESIFGAPSVIIAGKIGVTCPGIFRPNAFRDNDSFNLRSRYEESTVFRRTDCSDIARGRS
jgi:hypothetical protein